MNVYVLLHLQSPHGDPLLGAFTTLEDAKAVSSEAIACHLHVEPTWEEFGDEKGHKVTHGPAPKRWWRPKVDGKYHPHEITEVEVGMPLYEKDKVPA